MRDIKFRSWNEDEKVMIDGDSLAFEGHAPISELLSQDGIMQFTGLKDMNGLKDIYEGDIVKDSYISHLDNKEKPYIWVVEYETGMYWLRPINKMKHHDSFLFLKFTRIEVIGNIYEHPHLLQDKA